MITFKFYQRQIIIRSIDYLIPFIIGVLVLICLVVRTRSRGIFYCFSQTIFGLYILALIGVAFFPIGYPENWPVNLNWETTFQTLSQVNLIPFNFGTLFSPWTNPRVIVEQIVGNIFVTLPFGLGIWFFIPYQKKSVLPWVIGAGFSLEAIQLTIKLVVGFSLHSIDINDVILNATGVWLGTLLYIGIQRMIRSSRIFS